ncbi:MAG: ribosome small subunit-dependent GTPase A [Myxococcota bacterium]|nr:ribosome small subunit-dependent GTPase A [Myxococcota bacterium]
MDLKTLGWTPEHQSELAQIGVELKIRGLLGARVVSEHRGAWRVRSDKGEVMARATGRLRHRSESIDLPGVGDFVALRLGKGRRPTVEAVLGRKSLFVRKVAGLHAKPQVVAANIDRAFLLMALDGDFNLRRMERYLAATWESGAEPVVLLNKTDQVDPEDVEEALEAVEEIAAGAPVLAIAAKHGAGLEALAPFLEPRMTVCLLGSSGVGKSTLLNQLVGEDLQATAEVREKDAKGRHTTTHRELFALPGGALVVDTPGMREMRLWSADGLDEAFPEIASLAAHCLYNDCRHNGDEGCAFDQAVEAGSVDPERVEAWRKLREELQEIEQKRQGGRRGSRKK